MQGKLIAVGGIRKFFITISINATQRARVDVSKEVAAFASDYLYETVEVYTTEAEPVEAKVRLPVPDVVETPVLSLYPTGVGYAPKEF